MKISVIGGGASGLAAAIEAKRTNKNAVVTVFEKNPRVGKKLLVTGNGRCNLTNVNADIEFYYGDASFAEYALTKYDYESNIEFFNSMGLFTFSEENRVYPMSGQASSVLDALRFECENLGVEFLCDTFVSTVKRNENGFLINGSIKSDKVIIACGGKSSKVHGSDGFGFEILKSLSHSVTKLCPALVPLVCEDFPKSLKGIRAQCDCTLKIDGKMSALSSGEVQFCDYGLSGIPIMELSRFVSLSNSKDIKIVVDNVNTFTHEELTSYIKGRIKENPTLKNENLLTGIMNKMLSLYAEKLCQISPSEPGNALSDEKIKALSDKIKNMEFFVSSTRGFDFSQVTAGGADCSEFDKTTMQSCKVKGLYACGEVLNVDGACGGYNLQWAWSSGRLAGYSCALNSEEK